MPCNHECKHCGAEFSGPRQKSLALEPSPGPIFVDLSFPVHGNGGKEWPLTARQTDEWREAFPTLDVLAECRKARAWLAANGLKTPAGMPRFLVSWLSKATDRAVAPGGPGSRIPPAAARPDPYCTWHHTPGSQNKPSNRPSPGCPFCKEIRARNTLRSSEPTPGGDFLSVVGGRKP